jgi:hypothetical protein
MNNLRSCLIRVVVAVIVFLATCFISLLVLKVSFGNPYNFDVAKNVGYILLLLTLVCVLYVDSLVKEQLSIQKKP